ncbi:flagellar hook-basal body complex protein [Butyrivibrio sp. AE3004]|uniref:flagellar hook-basal body complex protein n=1 Tax=Butyrivibrio sp. AE3004 TaxID=1506994 RepID=UPI00068994D6|nr:flagellar hook-basal body complex protein [Butyrivibrio sp. AE3004]
MMRSLFSGVAGLKTHQVKMDVIGNNIANVNTTSFKSQSITFSDLMYQTTQRASRATERTGGVNARQIGLGAKSGAIATAITQQGATETTNNPFDMRITGDAFYVVNNGNQTMFTRDGSFYVDGAGNLAMQSTGYFVYGWTAIEDPETGAITVNTNGGIGKLQIMSPDNMTYPPEGTTEAVVSGNIDAHDTNITSDNGKTVSLEFYDNLGYLYTAKFAIRDVDDVEHTYSITLEDILDSTGNTIGAEKLQYVTFTDLDNEETVNPMRDSFTKNTQNPKYTATVGASKASFKTATGTTAYSGVPVKGFISDLQNNPNYSTLLDEVYSNSGVIPDNITDISGITYDPDWYYVFGEDGSITMSALTPDADAPTYGDINNVIGDTHISSCTDTGTTTVLTLASDTNVNLSPAIAISNSGTKWSALSDEAKALLKGEKGYYNIDEKENIETILGYDDTTVTLSADGSTLKIDYIDVNDNNKKKVISCKAKYDYSLDLSDPDKITYNAIKGSPMSVPRSGLISNLTQSQKNLLQNIYQGAVLGGTGVAYEIYLDDNGDTNLRIKSMEVQDDPQSPVSVNIGTNYVETDITPEIQDPMGATTVTILNAAAGGDVLYDSIPRTGYVSEIADATLTKDFFSDVYNYTVDKGADNYEKLTYRILDNGNLQVVNNSAILTYDANTGKITSPTEKLKLDFDQLALIDGQPKMAGFTDVNLDFSTTTNYNTMATSTVGAVKGDKESLKTGRAVGEMNGVTVSKDGTIYATYSNGQTKLLGQIATAEFANASGLEKNGDNLYTQTLNSGEATIQDVTTDGGYITTGVLEMSNVDLSSEFTSMITTQRGFQANSRIITVSDTLLEELTNLKR